MPDKCCLLGHDDLVCFRTILLVEQTQFDLLRLLRKNCKVYSGAVPRSPQGVRTTGKNSSGHVSSIVKSAPLGECGRKDHTVDGSQVPTFQTQVSPPVDRSFDWPKCEKPFCFESP